MIRILIILASAAMALVASSDTLSAQAITSPYQYIETRYSVGPYLGYLATSRGSQGQGPHPAPIFGARGVMRFTGPLSGEVTLGGVSTQRSVLTRRAGATDTVPPIEVGQASLFLVMADAGLRFNVAGPRSWNGLAPYASAGGGVVANLAGAGALDEAIPEDQRVPLGPAFALNLGAGTDWFLNERFSLRAEARDYIWRLAVPEGLSPSLRRETSWSHHIALTLGGAIHF